MSNKTNRNDKTDKDLLQQYIEIKQENHKLKRLVARLQKSVQKMEGDLGVLAEVEEEPKDQGLNQPKFEKPPKLVCGNCGSDALNVFKSSSGKSLVVCRECKERIFS